MSQYSDPTSLAVSAWLREHEVENAHRWYGDSSPLQEAVEYVFQTFDYMVRENRDLLEVIDAARERRDVHLVWHLQAAPDGLTAGVKEMLKAPDYRYEFSKKEAALQLVLNQLLPRLLDLNQRELFAQITWDGKDFQLRTLKPEEE
jgi:hypothetical protein